jgi:hypothetical protein
MQIDRDLTALVGWVHYLNTIAKFGLRHWKPDFTLEADSAASIDFDTFHPAVCSGGAVFDIPAFNGKRDLLILFSQSFQGSHTRYYICCRKPSTP